MAVTKAVRWHGNRKLTLDEVEIKPLSKDQVKLHPKFVGICGSDVGEWLHGPHLVGDSEPCSPGHEFSAIVAEVHPSVTGFSIGDHVVVNPLWRCDGCHMCANSRPNLCLNQKYHGYNLDGGLSESLVIDAARCYRVPESVGLDIAALVEPLSVAWHAVQSSGLQKAKSVMVIGTGPVGIATILCLQALGVDNIMVVGRSPVRNEFVKSLGIKNVYLSSDEGLLRTSKSLFDGIGPHVVFDAAATQSTVDLGIDAVRSGGTFYIYGIYHEKIQVNLNQVFLRALTLKGDVAYPDSTFPQVIQALVDGKFNHDALRSLITKRVSLVDAEEGVRELAEKRGQHIKIMVKVS